MITTTAKTENMTARKTWSTTDETLTIEQGGQTVVLNQEDIRDLRELLKSSRGRVQYETDND